MAVTEETRSESELNKFVRECSFGGSNPNTMTEAEQRLASAVRDLVSTAVDLSVGKVLLILRDEGILKVD
jgi:hypothetical protein